ncbi:MAG: YabP/YqfC family sporulation protein [Fusicatenibacter sp.]|nr:YabP/YqfC family sporulation protein [Lachnospiraceae bacterium]MDY2938544.1 YabP/YqfC family sporulation protein [Fusicatenibacter sp.]
MKSVILRRDYGQEKAEGSERDSVRIGKKGKKKDSVVSKMLSSMQVPADLSYRESVITFFGNREVYIENYRKILQYDPERLRILTRNGILSLEGKCLQINYYSNEEMKITGDIRKIIFDP